MGLFAPWFLPLSPALTLPLYLHLLGSSNPPPARALA